MTGWTQGHSYRELCSRAVEFHRAEHKGIHAQQYLMRNPRCRAGHHVNRLPRGARGWLARRPGETEMHPVYRSAADYVPVKVSHVCLVNGVYPKASHDIHFHVSSLRAGIDQALPREGHGGRKPLANRLLTGHLPWWLSVVSGMIRGCDRCAAGGSA